MKPVVRQRRRIAILVLILIFGTVAYIEQTQPDLQPLGGRVRRALALDSAETRTWWLTEHELLVLRNASTTGPTFARYNIDNNAETSLPALSTLYRESAGKVETVRPAPTGDWLLWTGNKNSTYVATLDGHRHYRVPEKDHRLNVWNYTGSGWYGLNLGYDTIAQVTEHLLDAPLRVATGTAVAYPFLNDPNAVDLDHITPKSPNQLIVPLWPKGKGKLDDAYIVLTGFGPSPSSVSQLKLPAPYLNSGGALAFSPQSDQMVWQLDILLPAARFWSDMGFPTSSRYSIGFFVTDHAGRNVPYGYLDADRKDPASHPSDLQFSPGGAYFSFVLHKALWIVHT